MEMLSADPIGTAQKIDTVDQYVQSKIAEWKQFKEENNPKWWQFWKNGTVLCVAVRFLIDALDYLIDHVETVISSGPDKKAVVLAAIAVLYDFVIREAIPVWMWPISGKVKQIVIYVIISAAIDWIVKKYRDGMWVRNSETIGGTSGQTTQAS